MCFLIVSKPNKSNVITKILRGPGNSGGLEGPILDWRDDGPGQQVSNLSGTLSGAPVIPVGGQRKIVSFLITALDMKARTISVLQSFILFVR